MVTTQCGRPCATRPGACRWRSSRRIPGGDRAGRGAAGIAGDLSTIVTADDVEHGKPHPEGYRLALERLGVDAARTVAFEDTEAGVASAKDAGLYCVAVRGTLPDERLARADEPWAQSTWRSWSACSGRPSCCWQSTRERRYDLPRRRRQPHGRRSRVPGDRPALSEAGLGRARPAGALGERAPDGRSGTGRCWCPRARAVRDRPHQSTRDDGGLGARHGTARAPAIVWQDRRTADRCAPSRRGSCASAPARL